MALTIPDSPSIANAAESQVWRLLTEQLLDDDLVVWSQRVTDHSKDHEVDFVVAIAGAGVMCLEVKGGSVWHNGTEWMQGDGHVIHPVTQAREACYALREYVESDPRWTLGRVHWAHMVVLPHTALPADFALPDCPRHRVIDRTQLHAMLPLMQQVLSGLDQARTRLSASGVQKLATTLAGRGLPQRDVVAQALENESTADALTREQAVLLRAIGVLDRVEIRGGAGSGKTYLALEQARRLTRADKRVALLCYSHGLASYLERITAAWNYRDRPAYVGEFHDLGIEWGAARGPDEPERTAESTRFWEHTLPEQMAELARNLPDNKRFDALVIDEAQDFADMWWTPLLACLRDSERSTVVVFSDEGQRVFDRFGQPPVSLVPLVLDHNLRNTRPIARAFEPLVGQRMHLRGSDGPAVRFVPCSADDALAVADDQIDPYLELGWRPEDIALLSTGSRHDEQKERQKDGNAAYWASFWDSEQVFYGHVLGFKGLERRVVVLALNERTVGPRSSERLYVGLSRARDELVVCGDPEFVRAVGGDDLVRRLGVTYRGGLSARPTE